MSIVPVVLDARLSYVGGNSRSASLLLLPTPRGRLLDELSQSIAEVTSRPITVATAFEPYERYESQLADGAAHIDRVFGLHQIWHQLEHLEASDSVLLMAPCCYPADGYDLRPLCGSPLEANATVRHLLAFESTSLRSRELLQVAGDGRVRRIQRYFDPVAWPFATAVVASLVPGTCLPLLHDSSVSSLEQLRSLIAHRGIPSQDLAVSGVCYPLTSEAGALALCSRRLLASPNARQAFIGTRGDSGSAAAFVDPTARIVGPVTIGDGARVEAEALIIGPSLIGAGAVVGRAAVVAQSLVVTGAVIADGAVIRQRVADSDHSHRTNDHRRHDLPAMNANSPLDRPARNLARYVTIKSVVEPVAAALVLIPLAPLIALITILVRTTSSGPVFFGDVREGKDGVRFHCWKFRSMLVNADEMQRALKAQQAMDGPQFKMDRDPRVTPVGRWLRRLNFDELPQLWNVLRGQMSFVGPRPSPFRENQVCVPWRNGRLSVRPGITGLWQVCRHDRELGDFHQWIYYDLLYVRNVSAALDLKILVGTLLTLGGKWPIPLARMLGSSAVPAGSLVDGSVARRGTDRVLSPPIGSPVQTG